jgi:F0F1-type ATP synthase assembly protein I
MQTELSHSGDLSQESERRGVHPKGVMDALAPSARGGRRFYNMLSASSVGLELGLSVVFGVLFGRWLDGKLGTEPWMMLLFFAIGLTAGFRSVLRAVKRADRAAEAEARRG